MYTIAILKTESALLQNQGKLVMAAKWVIGLFGAIPSPDYL
jgi:hypothetical protein